MPPKIPLMIDNTFASPVLCRPLTLGADIVFHSATKFIGGHGVAIGGVIVESGRFDWEGSGKFPTLTEPYAGYHGIDFAEEFGPHAFVMRARTEGVRDFGSCMAPQTAFYLLQGLETLPLRMARHVENARKVIAFLKANPAVERIASPELPDHPDHALAQRLLPKGCGSIFSFDIKGGREAGRRFIERLKLFSHLANVGDAKSLVIHPASTTHAQLDAAALKEAGIGEGMIRLSVGLEDPDDLFDDLGQALRAAAKAGADHEAHGQRPHRLRDDRRRRLRSGQAGRRLPPRRRLRPHDLAPADPLVRPSRAERSGDRLPGARLVGRAGLAEHRRHGRLDRGADRGGRPRARGRWSAIRWAPWWRSRPPRASPTGCVRSACAASRPRCRFIPRCWNRPRPTRSRSRS